MTNETEFDFENMSEEQLADWHLNEAVKNAKVTLQLNENCYLRFGEQILSDVQKTYFEKMANGIFPTDEEQAAMAIETVKQERQSELKKSSELGKAYAPTLYLEDRTEGFAVN